MPYKYLLYYMVNKGLFSVIFLGIKICRKIRTVYSRPDFSNNMYIPIPIPIPIRSIIIAIDNMVFFKEKKGKNYLVIILIMLNCIMTCSLYSNNIIYTSEVCVFILYYVLYFVCICCAFNNY